MPDRLSVLYKLRVLLNLIAVICAIVAIYFLVVKMFWIQVVFWGAAFVFILIANSIKVTKQKARFPRKSIQ